MMVSRDIETTYREIHDAIRGGVRFGKIPRDGLVSLYLGV